MWPEYLLYYFTCTLFFLTLFFVSCADVRCPVFNSYGCRVNTGMDWDVHSVILIFNSYWCGRVWNLTGFIARYSLYCPLYLTFVRIRVWTSWQQYNLGISALYYSRCVTLSCSNPWCVVVVLFCIWFMTDTGLLWKACMYRGVVSYCPYNKPGISSHYYTHCYSVLQIQGNKCSTWNIFARVFRQDWLPALFFVLFCI